jgi:hypothetical protein
MTSPRILFASALAAVALAAPGEARANVETWELWTSAGARLVPVRRLRLTFTHHTRFSDYGLRRIIPEFEVDYRVIGPLRLNVGYRYLWRLNGLGELEEGHRVHGDITAQINLRRLDIEFRSRVQWRTVGKNDNGYLHDEDNAAWRNRVNVEWTFRPPLTVNAFAEHWARFDEGFAHDRWRTGVGLSADVAHWRFQLYYQRDMPDFIDSPNVNMFGVSARWNLDLNRQ